MSFNIFWDGFPSEQGKVFSLSWCINNNLTPVSPNCLFDGNGGGRLRSRIQRFAFPLVSWWDQVTHNGATVSSFAFQSTFFFLCGKYHHIYYSLIFSVRKRIWYYSYFYYLLFYSCSIAIRAVCSFLFEVLRGSCSWVILILDRKLQ